MAAMPATKPPMAPSTLFFGLIERREAAPAEGRPDVELRGVGDPDDQQAEQERLAAPRVANDGRERQRHGEVDDREHRGGGCGRHVGRGGAGRERR